MEDQSSSEEESKKSFHVSFQSVKKCKLNNGSSQDSVQEAGSSTKENDKKDENADSGISVEPNSSDDRGASTSEGPSNELVHAAPSGSNVSAFLLNIIRPLRNYRKRKTPGRDSDSNGSTDSDDLSDRNQLDNSMQDSRQTDNSSSDPEMDLPEMFSNEFSSSQSSTSSSNTSNSNVSYESDLLSMPAVDSDDDDDDNHMETSQGDEENKCKTPTVLTKAQPKHTYFILREVINREMGLSLPCGKTTTTNVTFEKRFRNSLHAVYRLKKSHTLNKHKGCVNSINFHPEGKLLASGSDDLNVIIWDWAKGQQLQTIKTGHKSNVLQSKFLYLNARSQLNIVTCGRDGQVRLLQCPASGAGPGGAGGARRRLAAHARPAHKLHVSAAEPHSVLTCGEDGLVMHCDVRAAHANRLFHVRDKGSVVQLYSIEGHPLEPRELLLAGRDRFLRIYDRRRCSKPLAMYCPGFFHDSTSTTRRQLRMSMMHLTCAVYNHNGTEILGSYNDEDIYLFDTKKDAYDEDQSSAAEGYSARYSGHRNSATFKGVAFYGDDQYVASGSDCGHLYLWHKQTSAILAALPADNNGVVNCIEEHPQFPILATSGLDKDVKIWTPRSHKDPDYHEIEKVVKENAEELPSPLFNEFLPSLYNAWQADALNEGLSPRLRDIEFDGNTCTAF